jgi:hypothetical protein
LSWLEGESGYSEYTPGTEGSVACRKGVFNENWSWLGEGDYRKLMLTAETCLKFEETELPPPTINIQLPGV